ncbi:hypothetical protein B0J17DRAFT_568008, partial [Rhizoctonia solani]
ITVGCPTTVKPDGSDNGQTRLCPRCNNGNAPANIVAVIGAKKRTWLEICFIPLVPMSSSHIWNCSICGWHVDQNQSNGYAPPLPGPPPNAYNPHYQPNYGPPPGTIIRRYRLSITNYDNFRSTTTMGTITTQFISRSARAVSTARVRPAARLQSRKIAPAWRVTLFSSQFLYFVVRLELALMMTFVIYN